MEEGAEINMVGIGEIWGEVKEAIENIKDLGFKFTTLTTQHSSFKDSSVMMDEYERIMVVLTEDLHLIQRSTDKVSSRLSEFQELIRKRITDNLNYEPGFANKEIASLEAEEEKIKVLRDDIYKLK